VASHGGKNWLEESDRPVFPLARAAAG
jgi:hypothetical protein